MQIASEKQNSINTLRKIMKILHSLVLLVCVYLCHFICSVLRDWRIHWKSWYSLTCFLTEMSKERFAQRSVCMCVCCWLNGIDVRVGMQCLAH